MQKGAICRDAPGGSGSESGLELNFIIGGVKMNKKCGNCGFYSDKCKNQKNKNYNKFRSKEDRCNGNLKSTNTGAEAT